MAEVEITTFMDRVSVFKDAINIAKYDGTLDAEGKPRNLVFGWASVALDKAGDIVIDGEGDTITPTDLEDAAYDFVMKFGEGANVSHGGPVVGRLAESMMFTPDKMAVLGLAKDALPVAWWVGFKVDDATFAAVQKGELTMFSIEGTGKRVAA